MDMGQRNRRDEEGSEMFGAPYTLEKKWLLLGGEKVPRQRTNII